MNVKTNLVFAPVLHCFGHRLDDVDDDRTIESDPEAENKTN